VVWEERWHPLREEWVIVAAHRQNRPWIGETVGQDEETLPSYISDCYLCPGNARVSGAVNPRYEQTFVFDNDHPCVGMDAPVETVKPAGIYRNRPAQGLARVVCYSPRHNLTLAELATPEIERLLAVWQEQYIDLGSRAEIDHVLVFENKGDVVGVSNPHPHCQIYATNFIFKTIETEARASRRYFEETGRILFQDILAAEHQDGRRIIYENDSAIVFIPYFARYAYEVFVAPKATHPSLAALSKSERRDFADALKRALVKFDNLWQMPFPYVMPLHQAPTDGGDYASFHFHIEFHPPLRKPNLLKYLAGPEIGGGNFLSDTSAEEKAAELRAQSDIHYKQGAPESL
jgi:UDPglucose--hexose-1-phosphate uridylyltransferase